MRKKEFVAALVAGLSPQSRSDVGMIRFAFTMLLDLYARNGDVTETQAQRWYLTDTELNSIKRRKCYA